MIKLRKRALIFFILFFTIANLISYIPASAFTGTKSVIPKVAFITRPRTEYNVGDKAKFTVKTPNYSGKVEYRVTLWDEERKVGKDLWNATNGHRQC